MRFPIKALCLLLFLAVLAGCSTAPRPLPAPEPEPKEQPGYHETGKASFYADRLHNRKTASGERYNAREITAAHRTLPFGTKVRVTNVHNGKSVVVRINDRGPFMRGRVIDLSRAAFTQIGNLASGLMTVRLEVLP